MRKMINKVPFLKKTTIPLPAGRGVCIFNLCKYNCFKSQLQGCFICFVQSTNPEELQV